MITVLCIDREMLPSSLMYYSHTVDSYRKWEGVWKFLHDPWKNHYADTVQIFYFFTHLLFLLLLPLFSISAFGSISCFFWIIDFMVSYNSNVSSFPAYPFRCSLIYIVFCQNTKSLLLVFFCFPTVFSTNQIVWTSTVQGCWE